MTYEVIENCELKKYTSFKVGGCAPRAFFPESTDDFVELLCNLDNPLILGACSNVLISSDGVDCDVIITTKLKDFSFENNRVQAQCGVKVPMLAKEAAEKGLSGIEFMVGFPGTVGGAVCMNASAHSQAISDTFSSCKIFDLEKKTVCELKKDELMFSYRHSVLQEKPYILLEANFELRPDEKESINSIMQRNLEFRKGKQPNLAMPNAGSIFRNPLNDSAGRLLEKAGVKGLKSGGAAVWLGHANFIINENSATSTDILNLMYQMYNMVKDKYTIELVPEVKFVGRRTGKDGELWNTMLKK